jgi:AcrR family transcriptional regulator
MAEDAEVRQAGGVAIVRRTPFSDNPRVGARGQRTQQRILDSALRVFGDEGYHGASIDRIAKVARCSRVSFYQYFASKEDVFGRLAEQLARQLLASTEALAPLTSDAEGRAVLEAWVGRYAEIYDRYEPVVHAYEADDVLAGIAARTGAEVITTIQSKLVTATLPPRQLDPVVRLLVECLGHTFGIASALRSATPGGYPSTRVERAIADVAHRTLFGMRPGVNVHPADGASPSMLDFGVAMRGLLQEDDDDGNGARAALLASGREVFAERGYHGTRVDDLVAAAGVSHGAFYRYFGNKGDLARILTARALRHVGQTVLEMPDPSALDGTSGRALRRWLKRYNAAHLDEAAMLRVWMDAALQDPVLRSESAPPWDWGRRRMSRYLQPRGFGDIEMEAVVMVALLGVFGARQRPALEIEAAAHVIERGLLGRAS